MAFKSLICILIAVFVGWFLAFSGYYNKPWTEHGFTELFVSQIRNLWWGPPTTSTDGKNNAHHQQLIIFTKSELSKYKGLNEGPIYLAIFGRVYDVSRGRIHYAPGGAYSFFSGIDGSRAFVTGDFTESGLTDDVESLGASQLTDLSNWMTYYKEHYKLIGYLSGRFYDLNGRPTKLLEKIEAEIQEFKNQQKILEAAQNIFPPCNTEWKPTGSRVWCTQKSGGISRDWIGVPRQHFEAGSVSPTCVCVKADHKDYSKLREYKGCDPLATSCNILSE